MDKAMSESTACLEEMAVAQRTWVCEHLPAMTQRVRTLWTVILLLGVALGASAQIDPTKRELIQLGYNQPFQGVGPLAAYGFYYLNKPN